MGVTSVLTRGQHWAHKQQVNLQDGCTHSYPIEERHTAMQNNSSPFPLSVQKSNAHSGLKGMYLQIHTCVSKT